MKKRGVFEVFLAAIVASECEEGYDGDPGTGKYAVQYVDEVRGDNIEKIDSNGAPDSLDLTTLLNLKNRDSKYDLSTRNGN